MQIDLLCTVTPTAGISRSTDVELVETDLCVRLASSASRFYCKKIPQLSIQAGTCRVTLPFCQLLLHRLEILVDAVQEHFRLVSAPAQLSVDAVDSGRKG